MYKENDHTPSREQVFPIIYDRNSTDPLNVSLGSFKKTKYIAFAKVSFMSSKYNIKRDI
jgi:hypothetical protein